MLTTRRGFTLIELLVVIAIIALLVGILLPSLASARKEAQATKTASNIRGVGLGVAIYNAENRDLMPVSYAYADAVGSSTWRLQDQGDSNLGANGYIHWSYAIFNGDKTNSECFTSPAVPKGGAPRTNPGADSEDWETGQTNDLGQTVGAAQPEDRQVKRTAFTGNAAIFPRNKFNGSGLRKNRFVKANEITDSAKTILATEWLYTGGWKSLMTDASIIKSHRAISPIIGGSSGANVYNEADSGSNSARFFYPNLNELRPLDQLQGGNLMEENGPSQINLVGRQQPGAKDQFGGGSHFVFVDSHVERMTAAQSLQKRLWGDRYYSLTGNNKISLTNFN